VDIKGHCVDSEGVERRLLEESLALLGVRQVVEALPVEHRVVPDLDWVREGHRAAPAESRLLVSAGLLVEGQLLDGERLCLLSLDEVWSHREVCLESVYKFDKDKVG